MNKQIVGSIASVAGFVLIAGAVYGVSVATRPTVQTEQTSVQIVEPRQFAEATPTPTPTPEPVVVAPAPEPPAEAPVESGPVSCPGGSTANSSDGVNDTSCFPDICFSISVPNPDHPECDVAFIP